MLIRPGRRLLRRAAAIFFWAFCRQAASNYGCRSISKNMRSRIALIISLLVIILLPGRAYRAQEVRRIVYGGVSVDVVIDRPANYFVDVLITFPGTVASDDQIIPAARNILERTKEITNRTDMMIVSVAYPQEGRLMGDSVREAEAALLWVKEKSRKDMSSPD